MHELLEPLYDKKQTADSIKNLVNRYNTDLDLVTVDGRKLSNFSLEEIFNFVRDIPYRKDKKPVEIIARPYLIIKHNQLGMDCKKKTILLASWCKRNNFSYRFLGSSMRRDKKICHIFPQIFLDGQWRNIDATYKDYKIFDIKKNITAVEIL